MIQNVAIAEATPTLDTSIYAPGDRMGSIMTFEFASSGLLGQVTIIDKAKQSVGMKLYLYRTLPTIASADQAAFDISDTEAEKTIAIISIAASDFQTDSASNSVATKTFSPYFIAGRDGARVYGVLVSQGTPTYAASSLVVKLHVARD